MLRRFEGVNLVNLVEELKRQKLKLNSFDIVAKDNEIYVIAQKGWGLMPDVIDHGRWPLTEWAHTQLTEKTHSKEIL